jgi:hypothetical protein
MSRPLFQKSIAELETLFDEWQTSPEQLRVLKEELDHRKRPKAVRLRERVEALLDGNARSADAPPRTTQRTLFPDETDAPAKPARRPTSRGTSSASTNSQDYLAPPDAFTTVQPMGVRPRPNAFRPTLKQDLELDVSAGDPQVKIFRVALAELIREMKRRHVGHQQFTLEDGVRVDTDAGGCSYQFEFGEEANLFEGAKVEIIIGGRPVSGQLTAILQGRIVVTLQEDFGDRIFQCVLRIDNTALLQSLHDRLQAIDHGEATDFRSEIAEAILTNAGDDHPCTPLDGWPWPQPPTSEQRRFVEVALANDLVWLWGPPGTGKTASLSALCRLLYQSEKRVLICSNTNRAVDQLLQKLCRNLQETNDPSLEEGRILRLGRIEDELEKEFGELITPDRIVERKSADLVRRRDEVEAELERLAREVEFTQQVLSRFAALDVAQQAAGSAARKHGATDRDLKQHKSAVSQTQHQLVKLNKELERWKQAGMFRKMFMRDEVTIRRDINNQQIHIQAANRRVKETEQNLLAAAEAHNDAVKQVRVLQRELEGEVRQHHQRVLNEYDLKQGPLRRELSVIAAKLEDIRNSVLREARIVGATVTRTFLQPSEFASFDTVIVDEASMILLPAVFHAAGLAREKVVIAGDFRQLPPIIQTEQQSIHDVLSPDIFERAGIRIETVNEIPRLIMLNEQFRMDDTICQIVSTAFYDQRLSTHSNAEVKEFCEPEPLSDRLTIIDTSFIWPFTTRNAFQSRLNLMHALAIRNLVLHLRKESRLFGEDGRCRVGVCTPYAAQAKLLRDIFRANGLDSATLRASTVHGFQGDERPLMIIDLVDSVGERRAGIFLQANQLNDSGARLMNVALSRAQEGLIIVGNLTFLDQKLPSDAILRGLLHDLQRLGRIIDVRDILALYPILEDLKCFGSQPDLDPETIRTGLFGGRDFAKLCRLDMENARKSIVIFSGFITPERAAKMGDVLRAKINEGVKVRCVTRPPNRNGSMPEELGKSALAALEAIGAAVDLRNEIHEKVVLIDNRIAWFGSLNPLSHTARTTELMARVDDSGVASHIASILSLRRRSIEEFDQGAAAEAENPRCEECGGWSVLVRGRYGPFFRCAQGCDWKENVDGVRIRRR